MNKEEKLKELLNKVKETPDNIIEEAIDKLHIEYIKDSKEYIEHEIKTGKLINGYTDIHIFQTEVELLLKYIQHLEQKESILDKVTEFANKIATEYSELRNIINKYEQLARNKDWEAKRANDRYQSLSERNEDNYNKIQEEKEQKEKWENYYKEVCNKYAKLEIELDLAKAKIEILEGEKK